MPTLSRRHLLATLAAGTAGLALPRSTRAAALPAIHKVIPSTGRDVPVIGMGTWQTFNVGDDPQLRAARTEVLRAFVERGGGVLDSSPMYGSSQAVIGHAIGKLRADGAPVDRIVSADKIWTSDGDATRTQLSEIEGLWGVAPLDLVQVHNLRAWEAHLATLQELKAAGRVSMVGVTTSHGRRHDELEAVMKAHDLDFVQLTCNLTHRAAEARLLPLAAERGIAVIANRPFDGGALVKGIQRAGHPLPPWAAEWDVENWPQLLLKWLVSHPAVTVAIPATTKVAHVAENMGAARGRLMDAAARERVRAHIEAL